MNETFEEVKRRFNEDKKFEKKSDWRKEMEDPNDPDMIRIRNMTPEEVKAKEAEIMENYREYIEFRTANINRLKDSLARRGVPWVTLSRE